MNPIEMTDALKQLLGLDDDGLRNYLVAVAMDPEFRAMNDGIVTPALVNMLAERKP